MTDSVSDQAKLRAKWKRRGVQFDGPRPICTECMAPGFSLWDAGRDGGDPRYFCLCEKCDATFRNDAAERRLAAGLT